MDQQKTFMINDDGVLIYAKPDLHDIIIPDGVREIGEEAFVGHEIHKVTVPEGVKVIRRRAFSDCDELIEVNLPNSLIEIEDEAFYACKELSIINFPDGLEAISSSAFSGCSSLVDGDGFVIVRGICYGYYGDSLNVIIPEGVKQIGDSAFNWKKIERVEFPSTLINIGELAFSMCKKLKEINCFPNHLESIARAAFYECSNLSSEIVFPESLTSIGDEAFYGCTKLSNEILLPKSLRTIGDEAFSGCCNLPRITGLEHVDILGSKAFSGCEGLANSQGMLILNKTFYNYFGFNSSIQIPDGVERIAESAFENHYYLTDIILPDTLKEIGKRAFFGCSGLNEFVLPDSVETIGKDAFTGCSFKPKGDYMNECDDFAPVNMLIKGTPDAIQEALDMFEEYLEDNLQIINLSYEYCAGSTYDPGAVDQDDTKNYLAKILVADGLALDYGAILSPDSIPFAELPDVKYMILGEGFSNGRFTGLYALFKDFDDTENKECYHFSNLHLHFDDELPERKIAVRSFLDHTWSFDILDSRTGEYSSISFSDKKAKALIEQWKKDN